MLPLYDALIKDLPDGDLTDEEKRALVYRLARLDRRGQELAFLLVRVHGLRHLPADNVFKIPYGGRQEAKNIEFDLEKLPVVLRRLLERFSRIHLERSPSSGEKTKKETEKSLRID